MKAQITFIGRDRSPITEIELKSTNHGSFAGMSKLVVNGKIFYTLVTLMPEAVGKVFEIEKTEKK